MKKILIILFSVIISVGYTSAQSKKSIINKGIKSKVSYDYDLKGNKEIKIRRLVEKFDNKGNIIEEIRFNKEGKQSKHFVYKFNESNQLITKTSYDTNKKIKKITAYAYKNGLKISKTVKDTKGTIIEKETYTYTF